MHRRSRTRRSSASISGELTAPEGVDLTRPSAARVYDWYLRGSSNWAVDHAFGERAVATFPHVRQLAVANRRWLGRVVEAALDAGITQFLDLGSRIPSVGAVHEWVATHPRTRSGRGRVVYVDNEPVAAAHVDIFLDKIAGAQGWVKGIQEDLRDPASIFADPAEAAQVERFVESYKDTQNPLYLRNHGDIATWLTGWGDLLHPGVTHLPAWRPDGRHHDSDGAAAGPFAWCGVAEQADGSDMGKRGMGQLRVAAG